MPERRRLTYPMASAKIPATTIANRMPGITFMPNSLNIQTAEYEPTPRNAAWPKLR